MDVNTPVAPTTEESALLADLAVLCDGPAVEIHLSFDGGLIAVRSNDRLIFGTSPERGWQVAQADARAKLLLSWLRQAARTYVERKGSLDASTREVA